MKVFYITNRLCFVAAQADLFSQTMVMMHEETEWHPQFYGLKGFGYVIGFVFSW
jgi:hypothetical protein